MNIETITYFQFFPLYCLLYYVPNHILYKGLELREELTSYFFLFFAFHTNNTWIYPYKILKHYRRISLESHCPPSLPSQSHPSPHVHSELTTVIMFLLPYVVEENSSVSQEWKITNLFLPQTLKFLEKCRKKKKLFAPWQGLQDLTDARRVELKKQVDDYLRRHPVCSLLCRDISVTFFQCMILMCLCFCWYKVI